MPRNKGWFRVYDRMIDSPEILELTDIQFRVIVSLWALASAGGDENGMIEYRNGSLWRRIAPQINKDEFIEVINTLLNVGLLVGEEGSFCPKDWAKHQYLYDSKKPSTRKVLEKRREGNGKSLENVREVAGKQDADADTDTEKKQKQNKNMKKRYAPDVLLSEEEFQKLVDAHGEPAARDMINTLDNYKGASGKKYKSDYKAILLWVVSKWEKEVNHERVPSRSTEKPGNGSQTEGKGKIPDNFWA